MGQSHGTINNYNTLTKNAHQLSKWGGFRNCKTKRNYNLKVLLENYVCNLILFVSIFHHSSLCLIE